MGGGSPSMSGMSSPYEDSSSLALEQTEMDVVTNIVQGHQPMMTVLSSRHRNLQIVYNLWQNKDAKVILPFKLATVFHMCSNWTPMFRWPWRRQ